MKALNSLKIVLPAGIFLLLILLTSCTETVYIYQNGSTYNDYEVATNQRIKSATSKHKINSSKAPNWRKYNQQNKHKRYN